jgi:hypothetical protein
MIDKYNATFYKKLCLDYISLYENLLSCINGYNTIIEVRKSLMEQFFMGLPVRFSSSEDIENYIINLIMELINEFKIDKPEFYFDIVSRLNKVLIKNQYYARKVNLVIPEKMIALQDIDYYHNYLKTKDILNIVALITNSKTI